MMWIVKYHFPCFSRELSYEVPDQERLCFTRNIRYQFVDVRTTPYHMKLFAKDKTKAKLMFENVFSISMQYTLETHQTESFPIHPESNKTCLLMAALPLVNVKSYAETLWDDVAFQKHSLIFKQCKKYEVLQLWKDINPSSSDSLTVEFVVQHSKDIHAHFRYKKLLAYSLDEAIDLCDDLHSKTINKQLIHDIQNGYSSPDEDDDDESQTKEEEVLTDDDTPLIFIDGVRECSYIHDPNVVYEKKPAAAAEDDEADLDEEVYKDPPSVEPNYTSRSTFFSRERDRHILKQMGKSAVFTATLFQPTYIKMMHCLYMLKASGFTSLHDTRHISLDWNALYLYCKTFRKELTTLWPSRGLHTWLNDSNIDNKRKELIGFVNDKLKEVFLTKIKFKADGGNKTRKLKHYLKHLI